MEVMLEEVIAEWVPAVPLPRPPRPRLEMSPSPLLQEACRRAWRGFDQQSRLPTPRYRCPPFRSGHTLMVSPRWTWSPGFDGPLDDGAFLHVGAEAWHAVFTHCDSPCLRRTTDWHLCGRSLRRMPQSFRRSEETRPPDVSHKGPEPPRCRPAAPAHPDRRTPSPECARRFPPTDFRRVCLNSPAWHGHAGRV